MSGAFSTLVPFRYVSESESETRRFGAVYNAVNDLLLLAAFAALAVAFVQRRNLEQTRTLEGFLLATGVMMFLALVRILQVIRKRHRSSRANY